MIYPSDLEHKIGFDQIKDHLKKYTKGPRAARMVDELNPLYHYHDIKQALDCVEDFKFILSSDLSFPDKNFIDIEQVVSKVSIEGNYLEIEEWLDIKSFLSTFISCLSFFKKTEVEHLTALQSVIQAVGLDPILFKSINRVLDDSGKIRDTASDHLKEIRIALIEEQSRLRKEVERLLRIYKKEGAIVEDAEATIRSGRLVLPILAEYKRQIQGIIHDESGTGQTVFMEPISLLPYNNAVRELELVEKKEVIRLLMELTDFVRPYAGDLIEANSQVGWIDFIRAKATIAIELNAIQPELIDQALIDWKEAVHPLLYLRLNKSKQSVQPLSIQLNQENRLLILSGPNAGGKSVCMKTVGLLQYMLQCGLLIPVKRGTVAGIFHQFFIDIGDAQSLEDDLSTYSSHIKNLTFFLRHTHSRTLMLIDEFGSGTDPLYGTAIAESVLESLNELQAIGIITTHYAGIKSLAVQLKGLVNGSMRFDVKTLSPLYILDMGIPGSSFTLEIAEKSGLPKDRILSAREKLKEEQVEFSNLIRVIEQERTTLQETMESTQSLQRKLDQKVKEVEQKEKELQVQRKVLLQEARTEALQIVRTFEEKAQEAYKALSKTTSKLEGQKIKQQLSDLSRELAPKLEQKKLEEEAIRMDWKRGEVVALRTSDAIGIIDSIKGKSAIVQLGELKATVHFSELKSASMAQLKKVQKPTKSTTSLNVLEKQMHFSSQLDVRGKRTEEALALVDQWLSDALILGMQEVSILHGKGDGILRTMIRNHLKNYTQIKNVRDEHVDRGGTGITLCTIQ
ncbi:MAG: Smr/MutS family protein [Cytophagaceae bacterium]|jgi:DNA mismatch repair protein MutS2|nr:Smr/MutS family protein [Cytophagaceae bacterium]